MKDNDREADTSRRDAVKQIACLGALLVLVPSAMVAGVLNLAYLNDRTEKKWRREGELVNKKVIEDSMPERYILRVDTGEGEYAFRVDDGRTKSSATLGEEISSMIDSGGTPLISFDTRNYFGDGAFDEYFHADKTGVVPADGIRVSSAM